MGWDKKRQGGRKEAAGGPNVDQQRSKQVCVCISNQVVKGVKGGDEFDLLAIKAWSWCKRSKSNFGLRRWEEEHVQVIKLLLSSPLKVFQGDLSGFFNCRSDNQV